MSCRAMREALSLRCASFSKKIWHLYLAPGVISGIYYGANCGGGWRQAYALQLASGVVEYDHAIHFQGAYLPMGISLRVLEGTKSSPWCAGIHWICMYCCGGIATRLEEQERYLRVVKCSSRLHRRLWDSKVFLASLRHIGKYIDW
jgi:hypothetical protein